MKVLITDTIKRIFRKSAQEIIFEIVIPGVMFTRQQIIEELIDNGYSEEEATKEVFKYYPSLD